MHRVLTAVILLLALTAAVCARTTSDAQFQDASDATSIGRLEARIADLTARVDNLVGRLETLELRSDQGDTGASDPTDQTSKLPSRTNERIGHFSSQPDGVTSKVFTLANADARAIVKLVSKLMPSIESREVRIAADRRTNSVVAYGPADDLQFLESLIVVLAGSIESNDLKAH